MSSAYAHRTGPGGLWRSADVLVPMLVADLLGLAASSARVPAFGRLPHRVAFAVCVATAAGRVLRDRARHNGAVIQLVLLVTLARTHGGSRSHRAIAVAATAAAVASTAQTRRGDDGRS